MARRRRRGRRGFLPKTVGGWVSFGFKIAGTAVALSPALLAVQQQMNNPAGIPQQVAYNYLGWTPGGGIQWSQTASGVGAIVGGIVIGKLGSYVGRAIK